MRKWNHNDLYNNKNKLMAGVLPSKEIISERVGSCAICSATMESYFHLFKECQRIRVLAFASDWGCLVDNWPANNVEELIKMCVEPNSRQSFCSGEGKMIYVFLSTLFYCY